MEEKTRLLITDSGNSNSYISCFYPRALFSGRPDILYFASPTPFIARLRSLVPPFRALKADIRHPDRHSFMRITSLGSNAMRSAVVTGGNKGIGFEICRQLALEGIQVILTARDESRGIEAVEKLYDMGLRNVVFHQLEVTDKTSIQHLVKFVETNFQKLDILINNAGVIGITMNYEKFNAGGGFLQVTDENVHHLADTIGEPYDLGEDCLKINYYGAKRVTEALLPLLHRSKSPRIVNLSSRFGELHVLHNEKLKKELQDIEKLTEERIDEMIECFLTDFKDGKLRESGWPLTASAYKVSKVALNAYTRLMAKKFQNILVNCVRPGAVITDMTSHWGLLTPEEGAKSPVMVALLPDDGPSGVYFHQTEISQF